MNRPASSTASREPLNKQVVILNGVREVKNPGILRCAQSDTVGLVLGVAPGLIANSVGDHS